MQNISQFKNNFNACRVSNYPHVVRASSSSQTYNVKVSVFFVYHVLKVELVLTYAQYVSDNYPSPPSTPPRRRVSLFDAYKQ